MYRSQSNKFDFEVGSYVVPQTWKVQIARGESNTLGTIIKLIIAGPLVRTTIQITSTHVYY